MKAENRPHRNKVDLLHSEPNGDLIYHAFLSNGGPMTDLGTLGGSSSDAYAINHSGQVVGMASAGHMFYRLRSP